MYPLRCAPLCAQVSSAEWLSAHHLVRGPWQWANALAKWALLPFAMVVYFVAPTVDAHTTLLRKVRLTYSVAPKSASNTPSATPSCGGTPNCSFTNLSALSAIPPSGSFPDVSTSGAPLAAHGSSAGLDGVGGLLKASGGASGFVLPPSSSATDLHLASACSCGIVVEGTAIQATGAEAATGVPVASRGVCGEIREAGAGGSRAAAFLTFGDGSRELV